MAYGFFSTFRKEVIFDSLYLVYGGIYRNRKTSRIGGLLFLAIQYADLAFGTRLTGNIKELRESLYHSIFVGELEF